MQAQAVYSEILHRQPEAKAQKLDVIVHSDFPKYHVLETSVRVFWLFFFVRVHLPVSSTPVTFLMQTHQSERRRRCKMMFDKHSSQEASHSDFTTSGTWSNRGLFQS